MTRKPLFWVILVLLFIAGTIFSFNFFDKANPIVNLDIKIDHLLGIYPYINDMRGPGILIAYKVKIIGKIEDLQPGDDANETYLFSPEELPPMEEIAFRTNREIIISWLREKKIDKK